MMPHVATIHDKTTGDLLRVYVNEDHEDGSHMFTIKPGDNEKITVMPKSEVRGLPLHEIGEKAKQWPSYSL